MILLPIVEGDGEVAAVPVLLRRLRDHAEAWALEIGKPHRRRRTQLVQKSSLQSAVRVAGLAAGCAAILVLLDGDDDCPAELAPKLQQWAQEAAGPIPCAVVMANREYEAWFLAGLASLRGRADILAEAALHPDPERPRDAKGQLEQRMRPGASYHETVDQAPLTAHLDLAVVYRSCRSFRKLVSSFGVLATAAGTPPPEWPPVAWRSRRPEAERVAGQP